MMVLTKPTPAFTTMSREGGLIEPLIYAVIGGSIGLIAYPFFQSHYRIPSGMPADRNNPLGGMVAGGIGIVFFMILAPVFVAIGLFVASGILHICLMIVGGAKQPLRQHSASFVLRWDQRIQSQSFRSAAASSHPCGLSQWNASDWLGARNGYWPRRPRRLSATDSLLRRRNSVRLHVWISRSIESARALAIRQCRFRGDASRRMNLITN